MRAYSIEAFGLDNLTLVERPAPTPGPDDVLLDVKAVSLNYRDLLVVKGQYDPALKLPAAPLSDAAGVVAAVGANVTRVRPGQRVMTHFIADWTAGPYREEYRASTLGTPGPGVAAEQVALPERAVLPIPKDYSFAEAATLPIAALTAWSSIDTVYDLQPGEIVLTLGTGGLAIFTLQLAKALGAQVIITSSSDEKLDRCRDLGADHVINYAAVPRWEQRVLEFTDGRGVDLTVETAGPGTLNQSMRATRAGGTIALPGALTGRGGEITTGLILARRLTIAGVFVDCRARFEELVEFINEKQLKPIISHTFEFGKLREALQLMQSGGHFGKIVLTR